MKPYRRIFSAAIVLMIITVLFNNLSIYPIIPIVDNVFLHKYNPRPYHIPIIGTELHFSAGVLLIGISITWIGLIFLKGFFSYLQSYIMLFIGTRMLYDLRNKIYEHMIYLPLSYYANHRTGQLISRMLAESIYIYRAICLVLAEMLRQPITLIGYLVFIFILNWKMALYSICIIPIMTVIISRLGKKMRSYARKRQEKIGTLTDIIHETLRGVLIVKGFHMEEYEKERFRSENKKYLNELLNTERIVILSGPVIEFLGAGIGIGMILVYGGFEVLNNALTPGKYFAFVAVCLSMYKPLKILTQTYNRFQESNAALERLFEILDATAESPGRKDSAQVDFNRSICYKNVSFKYEDNPVLRNITLTIPKSSVTAFVGASGVGKTTLLNLLPRFYSPTDGVITIDGKDIRDYDMGKLREAISLVTQDTILFSDTIENNISYGNRKVNKDDICSAARAANAEEFILNLPHGYETNCGEGGIKLSGGQRQRIAIARAVLKNAPILILDEATSALDSESEKMVRDALKRLMSGRTTLVVAHRLSTVAGADRIVLIKDGCIDDVGTHDYLIKTNKYYKKLYRMQFLKDEDNEQGSV